MGLITSLMLLNQGIDVNLVAHVYPEELGSANGRRDHMASQIAGGLLLAYGYDVKNTKDNFEMVKSTWDLYKVLAKNKR